MKAVSFILNGEKISREKAAEVFNGEAGLDCREEEGSYLFEVDPLREISYMSKAGIVVFEY